MSTVLSNTHVTPESAYGVTDYPYGFKLRCQKRYWLESKPKVGVRLMTQTSNPKKGGIWNAAKEDTYFRFGAALYLDEAGHVHVTGIYEYTNSAEVAAWVETYIGGVPEPFVKIAHAWNRAKAAYEAKRAEGASMADAGASALVETAKAGA